MEARALSVVAMPALAILTGVSDWSGCFGVDVAPACIGASCTCESEAYEQDMRTTEGWRMDTADEVDP